MNPIRLLALALLPALFSCSAVVYKMGRDPAELLGRSRPSIEAEFGPPIRTGTNVYKEPVEFIRVKGSWRSNYHVEEALLIDVLTLGIAEPILFPYSIAKKAVVSDRGQDLVLGYRDGVVKQAYLREPGP